MSDSSLDNNALGLIEGVTIANGNVGGGTPGEINNAATATITLESGDVLDNYENSVINNAGDLNVNAGATVNNGGSISNTDTIPMQEQSPKY